MDTDRLIDTLATDLAPVRRLPSPERRVALWLAVALPVTALVVAAYGLREDMATMLRDPAFVAQELAALATALAAAWAAFSAGVPGARPWAVWAPAVPFAVWVATIGRQCVAEWFAFGAEGMEFAVDAECTGAIAVAGAVPALVMVVMMRRGANFRPWLTVLWGALAAAALAYAAHRLFHPRDAALLVLVWQFGAVVVYSALAVAARRLLVPAPAPATA
jgi:hypothetical protein